MNKLIARLRGGHRPDNEALSALADGALDAEAARTLEAHVGGCEACTARLVNLRRVKAMLSAMPHAAAPRSFRLRQADLEAPVRSRPAYGGLLRAMPVMSALGIIAFVVVLGADLSSRDDGGRLATAPDSAKESMFDRAETQNGNTAAGAAAPQAEATAAGTAPGALNGVDTSAPGPNTPEDDGAAARRVTGEPPQSTPEDQVQATRLEYADDGNDRVPYLIFELIAAGVAIAAAAVFLITRKNRRGVSS